MGVIDHCPGACMQDCQDADAPSYIRWIAGEFHEGEGSGLEQDGVQDGLMGTHQFTEFSGQGKDQMEIRYGKNFLVPSLQPPCGVGAVTLWTAAVPAGMIRIMLVATVVTLSQVPTQGLGTAGTDILKGSPVAGEHPVAKAGKVVLAESSKDLGYLRHTGTVAVLTG